MAEMMIEVAISADLHVCFADGDSCL